jgi:hypothetical protein
LISLTILFGSSYAASFTSTNACPPVEMKVTWACSPPAICV